MLRERNALPLYKQLKQLKLKRFALVCTFL